MKIGQRSCLAPERYPGTDLLGDEEGKNTETFSKSHGDNAKGQNVTESAGVTANSLHSLGTDEAHADSSASTSNGLGDISGNASSDFSAISGKSNDFSDHVMYLVWFVVSLSSTRCAWS